MQVNAALTPYSARLARAPGVERVQPAAGVSHDADVLRRRAPATSTLEGELLDSRGGPAAGARRPALPGLSVNAARAVSLYASIQGAEAPPRRARLHIKA